MSDKDSIKRYLRTGMTLMLMLFAGTNLQAQQHCTLSVGWEPYGVYSYRSQDGSPAGVDLELMEILGQEIGCQITFKQLPWSRHLLELEAGHIDVATSVRYSAERANYGWFSDPYRKTDIALYVRQGETKNYDLDRLADLAKADFRVGIVDGYYYGPAFDQLMEDPAFARQVENVLDYASTLRMLILGRIDGILAEDVSVLTHEAKALDLYDRIEKYPLSIPGDQFYLLFSKKSVDPATVAAINAALARMKENGRLQRLLDKYLDAE